MRILTISAKCSDLFSARIRAEGISGVYDGYVPAWFPNPGHDGGGDYVALDIDIDTGRILNWKKPTDSQLKQLIKGKSETT